MKITTQKICEIVKGELIGDPNLIIEGPSKIEEGKAGTISFLANPKYNTYAYSTEASALLVSKDFIPIQKIKPTLIKVENVYESLSKLLSSFENEIDNSGVATSAIIGINTSIHQSCSIGDYSIIKEGVVVGENSIIFEHVVLGKNVKVGTNCILYPGVKIYHDCIIGNNAIIHANAVIGSDGFGFTPDKEGFYSKIPQIGNVIIEDDVEIGANTTIDRATMGSTILKKGVKLDNLIQVAHNVVIGENTVIAAQAGIAGSSKIGKNCQIGGQVGISGHINIPDGTQIQGQSGIISSHIKENQKLYGSPALEYKNYLKSYAHFKNLPNTYNELQALKKEIDALKSAK